MDSTGAIAHVRPAPQRAFGRTVVPTGAVILAVILCLAGVAAAAFHTTNGIYHGIGSSDGGGMGSGVPVASATSGNGILVAAGVYHLRDDGGWNNQCYTSYSPYFANCWGTSWGTAPCKKYAWTEAAGVMSWHGHNSASC